MPLRALFVFTPTLLLLAAARPVLANPVGSAVTGSNAGMAFSGTDPITSVNSASPLNVYTITLSGNVLTINVQGNGNGTFPFTDTITDAAFTGYTEVSDTFMHNPGDTYTFTGNTFTFDGFLAPNPSSGTAVFNLTSAATTPSVTPEPSSLVLLGSGVLGVCGAVRRRLVG